LKVIQFNDGDCQFETWELPESGWEVWAATVDPFLAHAIRCIAAEYHDLSVEWLEINQWSGRLIVFPSQDGPHGDRGERVCFELSSLHLEAASKRVFESVSEAEQDSAYAVLFDRFWQRIGECLTVGEAAVALAVARQFHRMRIAGYDYAPGEYPWRLTELGEYVASTRD
jgi:hypothetical protein